MRRGLKFRNYKIARSQNGQRGYMLITLMLMVALMAIALLAVLPRIRQQVQRDRELELQHRGTAYMRAIQHFYKKLGRYPTRIEDLENTNNLKFLRKRYKDPVNRDPATGKERDFKLLHQQDITLNNGPVLPGQSPFGGPGGQPTQGGFGGNSQGGFGGGAGGLGGLTGGTGGAGAQQQPGPGSKQTTATDEGESGSDTEGNSSSSSSSSGPNPGSGSPSSSGFNGPTFGGGPIIGVASTNKKDKSIRVFFEKNHYNDWYFVYIPMADRGGLLTGPVNPNAPTVNLNGGTPAGGVAGQGAPGLGQPVTPNTGSQNPGPQPPQNPGQNPPEQ
jgi:type II secretory pathway pseudopilin PulG